MPRRDRIILLVFASLVAAWLVVQALTGSETGLLYLAPALVLALPLVGGRYVGEERLSLLAAKRTLRPRRAASRLVATHTFERPMRRGGRLVASSLAKRPPPAAAFATS
jgi:uncharacterized SAM-binding protein YcdF (DUF218 family)